ncbi:MAG TPA: nucleotidyltransferase family protein [bacterium]|nr:nucleotidyltransferase family protein [bacterium]HPP86712.1 nucleotidyltransferase family protein [bacterium]
MKQKSNSISTLILGAGKSERMNGYPKPLIKYKNKFFAEIIYENLIKLQIKKIVFVAGYKYELLKKYLDNLANLKIIENPNFENGQLSSLKCGLKYIIENFDTQYIMIILCDTPFIKLKTYRKLINEIEKDKIIIPSLNRKAGHPVIINNYIAEQIINAAPQFRTAKEILNTYKEKIKYVDVNDEFILKDFDYPNDLNLTTDFSFI